MTAPNPPVSQPASDKKFDDGPSTAKKASTDLPPFKPKPILFVLLGVILALWLGALGVMRLRMVIHPSAQTPTSLPAQ